jgi:hypothetical protein
MPQTPMTSPAPAPHHPAGADPILEERQALLYQYERCCDDWRHHDAIIWEMPLAAVTANAVIVWAAAGGGHAWHLALAWCIAGFVVGVMSLGLQKQLAYAKQIQARIRDIEQDFGLPRVTKQVGRPGFVSNCMEWIMRGLCAIDVVLAVIYVVRPSLLM